MVVESAERAVGEVSAAQVRALVRIVCPAAKYCIACLSFFQWHYHLLVMLPSNF